MLAFLAEEAISFTVPNRDTFESENAVVLMILWGICHKLELSQGKYLCPRGVSLGPPVIFAVLLGRVQMEVCISYLNI